MYSAAGAVALYRYPWWIGDEPTLPNASDRSPGSSCSSRYRYRGVSSASPCACSRS